MFPYLTTGLKKVWAAITALQSSLANVQGNSIGFVDYSSAQFASSLSPVSKGLYIFYIDGGSDVTGVGINVNGVPVFSASVRDNDSIAVPLYFEGGETVEFTRTNSSASMRAMYIPFKTS